MSVLIVEIHIFQQELYIVLRIISVELSKQIFSLIKDYSKMSIFNNEINLIEKKLKRFLNFKQFDCSETKLIKFISRKGLF